MISDGPGTSQHLGSAQGTSSSYGPADAVDDSVFLSRSCIADDNPVEVWVENWFPELGFMRLVS